MLAFHSEVKWRRILRHTVHWGSKHPVEPTDDGHEKAQDEQEHPKAIGPTIFGKRLKHGKRLSIGHDALRGVARGSSALVKPLY